jgi:hypothetical protein
MGAPSKMQAAIVAQRDGGLLISHALAGQRMTSGLHGATQRSYAMRRRVPTCQGQAWGEYVNTPRCDQSVKDAMPNQEESKDGIPRKDQERSTAERPNVRPGEAYAGDGPGNAQGGDGAPLGPPREILSDRNGPSDPDSRKK